MIREFLRSSAGVLLADLATKAIGFAMVSGLTFILGPPDFGRYSALLTTFTSLYVMSGLGVAIVLQRESARLERNDPDRLGAMIGAALVVTFMTMTAIVALYILFHTHIDPWLFKDMDAGLIAWIPLLTVLYFLVQMPLSLVLGMGLFGRYAIRNLVESLITALAVLSGGYLFGLKGIIAGLAISYGLNLVIVFVILRSALATRGIRIQFSGLQGHAVHLLKTGLPYFLGNTLFGAVAGILLVGLFATHIGFEELGYVRIGFSLAGLLMILPNAVKTVTITYLARTGVAARQFFSVQVRYVFFLIVATTLGLLVLLEPLVILLFGEPYRAGAGVFAMVVLVNVFFSMQQLLNSFIVGQGMLTFSGISNGIVVMLYILASLLLMPRWGMPGYYLAFGGSYLLGLLAVLHMAWSVNRDDDGRKVLWFSLSSLLVIIAIIGFYAIDTASWARSWMIAIILAGYTWVTMTRVFAPQEKTSLREVANGLLKRLA